jgi:hypothetical protein
MRNTVVDNYRIGRRTFGPEQKFWQKRKECFNTDKSDVWNRLYHVIRGKSDHMTNFQNK